MLLAFHVFEAYIPFRRLLECPKVNILHDNDNAKIITVKHTAHHSICSLPNLGHQPALRVTVLQESKYIHCKYFKYKGIQAQNTQAVRYIGHKKTITGGTPAMNFPISPPMLAVIIDTNLHIYRKNLK